MNLEEKKKLLIKLTKEYGLNATIEQQQEVIKLGKEIEAMESDVKKSISRENVILLIKGDEVEAWGSLTKLCEIRGFSYNYLKRKKFPFEYKGVKFVKVKFNTDTIGRL